MRILLDSHVLLWTLGSPDRSPRRTRSLIADRGHDLVLSAAGISEIAIKGHSTVPASEPTEGSRVGSC